jgi:hypothetical protein
VRLFIRHRNYEFVYLIKVSNQSGMPLASRLTFGTRLAEVKAFGDTLGYTSRFQTLIHSIHAKIAFDRLAGLGVPLGGSPGTGRNAGFAAHAKFFVYEDDAVRRAFLHGAGGAGCHAPRILAVEAGHKHIGHARQIVYLPGTDGYNLGQSRPNGQIVFCFAMGFTAEASDAALGILVDVIFTHMFVLRKKMLLVISYLLLDFATRSPGIAGTAWILKGS